MRIVYSIIIILLTSLSGAYGGITAAEQTQVSAAMQSVVSNPDFATLYGDLITGVYDDSRPAAFLNYIVFDDQMNIVPAKAAQYRSTPPAPVGTLWHWVQT